MSKVKDKLGEFIWFWVDFVNIYRFFINEKREEKRGRERRLLKEFTQ